MSMEDFWDSTPWQFAAAVEGWNKAQGGEDKPPPMSPERFDQILKERGYSVH
jgi:hypothetical protein